MNRTVSLEREDRGRITVLRLARGKANAIDLELLRSITAALDEIEHAGERAIVITADGGIFSAGVDLHRVMQEGDDYLEQFLPLLDRVFERLFWYPQPIVAGINGHAIAGGCVIAGACDYRIMVEGSATIGVPELRVHVPFPAVAIEILRFAAARAHFQELVYLGRTYSAAEAYERGLLDEVVPAGELLERSLETAERLLDIPHAGFWLTKRQLRWGAWQRMQDAVDRTGDEVMALWKAPETKAAIRRYVDERLGARRDGA